MIRKVCNGSRTYCKDSDDIPDTPQVQEQLADLIKELSRTLADLNKERESTLKDTFKTPYSAPPQPDHFSLENKSWPTLPKNHGPTREQGQEDSRHGSSATFLDN